MSILIYTVLGLVALIVVFFGAWRKRGQTIDSLKTDLSLQKLNLNIEGLKEEARHEKQEVQSSTDYFDSLKRANPDLVKRLGISPADDKR